MRVLVEFEGICDPMEFDVTDTLEKTLNILAGIYGTVENYVVL